MSIKGSVKPLENRVVVLPLPREEKTAGGLVIPEPARDNNKENKGRLAKVVTLGPGRLSTEGDYLPMESKVGETVVIKERVGTDIKLKDEDGNEVDHLIVFENDVLAVVEV